jgi:hypothetical protein
MLERGKQRGVARESAEEAGNGEIARAAPEPERVSHGGRRRGWRRGGEGREAGVPPRIDQIIRGKYTTRHLRAVRRLRRSVPFPRCARPFPFP